MLFTSLAIAHEGIFEFQGGDDFEIYSHLADHFANEENAVVYETNLTLEENLWRLAETLISDEERTSNHATLVDVILTIGHIPETSDLSKEKLDWILDHSVKRLKEIEIEFSDELKAKKASMEEGLDPFGESGGAFAAVEYDRIVDFYGASIVAVANTMGRLGLAADNRRFGELSSIKEPEISIMAKAGPEIVKSVANSLATKVADRDQIGIAVAKNSSPEKPSAATESAEPNGNPIPLSSENRNAHDLSSFWPYILGMLAMVSVIVLLLRSRTSKP